MTPFSPASSNPSARRPDAAPIDWANVAVETTVMLRLQERIDALRKQCSTGYGCGSACISLRKECRTTPRSAIGKERLKRLLALAGGGKVAQRGIAPVRGKDAGELAGGIAARRGELASRLRGTRQQAEVSRMKAYRRISASGQDLARRWARAGEAARRRGIDSYAGPPNRKKAERAATVDAAARAFRGAMAGAPGLRYRNAMSQQDTQQRAEKAFRARPRFSTRQRVKKGWS
jgi:hypothetical protein